MLAPDTLLNGRYLIESAIGQGGMGAVYKATDQRLGNPVAVKQMTVGGAQLSRAFEREARLLASLRHPALPRVIDHFSEGHGQFLVMEFIPGPDLGAMLGHQRAPFPLVTILRWADQALDGLEYLHQQTPPVIHRDIKPQNLKVSERNEIILLDFGLAKGSANEFQTSTSSIHAYTPQFAPLEQMQGTGTDERSDIYSLAATLYHLATNEKPVDALTRAAALVRRQPDPLVDPRRLNPAIPPAVNDLLLHALALNVDDRPASASVFRASLRQINLSDSGQLVSGSAPAGPSTPLYPSSAGQPTFIAPPAGHSVAAAVAAEPQSAHPVRPMPPESPFWSEEPLFRIRRKWRRWGAVVLLVTLVIFMFVVRDRNSRQPPLNLVPPTSVQVARSTRSPNLEPSPPPPPAASPIPPAAAAAPAQPQRILPVRVHTSVPPPSGPGDNGPGPGLAGVDFGPRPGPDNISDGLEDTAWVLPNDPSGESVTLDFGREFTISAIQVLPGINKINPRTGENIFALTRHIRRVRFEFSDGSTLEATFEARPELQSVAIPNVVASSVNMVILETSAASGGVRSELTPIGELVVLGTE
ncbi:MAG: protein kinase [Herpetosiphonaceae bacterium]|nr:protein kinase [Herpetosiphonaceae bacterium]